MDDCDKAQQVADQHLRISLVKVREARAQPLGPGSGNCIDCGDEIPEQRQVASPGCVRCVKCQQEEEEFRKWRG